MTSQRAYADRVFSLGGRTLKLRVIGKTALRVIGIFNSLLREFVEMQYLQTSPDLMDDRALADLIGPLHKTSYEDGFKLTFESVRAEALPTPSLRKPALGSAR